MVDFKDLKKEAGISPSGNDRYDLELLQVYLLKKVLDELRKK